MRKDIQIVNAVSDRAFTSSKRAVKLVAKGRAEWVHPGVSIRFIPNNHHHVAAQESANATRYWYERAVWSGRLRPEEHHRAA